MKKICTLLLMLTVLLLTVTALASCEKATEGLEFYEYGDGYSVGIKDAKYLDKIVIPKKHNDKPVVTIAKKGFVGCENVVSISIPDTVTVIEDGAFQNCYKLETIVIPSNVTTIGQQAFKGCKSLKSIELPSGVVSVGDFAFSNCKALSSITISDTVTSLGANAFEGCTSLVSVSIPKNVTDIGEGIFQKCTSLTTITVDESSESFANIEGALYSKDGTKLYQYPIGLKPTMYQGPDGLTAIGAYAFDGCELLTQITIPSTVTTVGEKAFNDCPVENATVPTVVIGYLSKDVLKIVDINGGEKIEKNAFRNSQMLKRLTISGSDVKTIGDSAFYNCVSLRTVVLAEGLETIDEYAFKGCVYLTDINLPNTLKTIGISAFKDCNRLTKIIIPFDVEKIGMYAFEGCLSLKTIYCRGAGRPKGWNEWWKVKDEKGDHTVEWRYDGE